MYCLCNCNVNIMFLLSGAVAAVIILFLLACAQCMATFQSTKTQYTMGKRVATSYMTLQPYSKIQCAVKCLDEKRQGRCSYAGYNAPTQKCYLSNDNQNELLETADGDFGVFYSDIEGRFRE